MHFKNLKPSPKGNRRIATLHRLLITQGISVSRSELTTQRFGKTTEAAIKALQQRYGRSSTGEIDEVTDQILRKGYKGFFTREGDSKTYQISYPFKKQWG